MAITREQVEAANARGVAANARGPVARSARYDSRGRLIAITLEGGCEFAFPAALAEGLADAPRSKLTKIKISANGLGLHWPLVDADLYVPGLIEGAFGSHRWMQQIGRLGGSSRSSAKAKASRENGKRGGRPKESEAA
ncbi:MAG: DUF2442 domain-containing protein [Steroidobacteraceae bacterium]